MTDRYFKTCSSNVTKIENEMQVNTKLVGPILKNTTAYIPNVQVNTTERATAWSQWKTFVEVEVGFATCCICYNTELQENFIKKGKVKLP